LLFLLNTHLHKRIDPQSSHMTLMTIFALSQVASAGTGLRAVTGNGKGRERERKKKV
jgi:hypothetical protein